MRSPQYDVAVIGGGIVGMASAMAILELQPRFSLVVLEAEGHLAAHQSGHNSGVIHSGLYYTPGSLKARNCAAGREALVPFCEQRGITYRTCGKVLVAASQRQLALLDALVERGRANGLGGLVRLGPEQIREREPHVRGLAGLWVPQTGVVDFKQVTRAYGDVVRERGGEIRLGTRVLGAVHRSGEHILRTTQGGLRCRCLLNCAGLQSDRLARRCGVDPGLRIVPFRGEYHELVAQRRSLVRGLVYPVPDPALPFLGVHFTRTIDDHVEAGPNAVLSMRREGYSRWSASAADLFDMVTFAGFWRMARRHWKTSLGEYHRSFSLRAMLRALRELVPDLQLADLQRGGCGVRAQAVEPDGRFADDFRILAGPRMLHVLNAPSPAATASIAIGQHVARRLISAFF